MSRLGVVDRGRKCFLGCVNGQRRRSIPGSLPSVAFPLETPARRMLLLFPRGALEHEPLSHARAIENLRWLDKGWAGDRSASQSQKCPDVPCLHLLGPVSSLPGRKRHEFEQPEVTAYVG